VAVRIGAWRRHRPWLCRQQSPRPLSCQPPIRPRQAATVLPARSTEPLALAVAIVTHDSAGDLRRFLAGQLAAAREIDAPVIVVDNASADETVGLLREAVAGHPSLTVHEMGRNAGYAAAVNAAFARAPGRDVLLVNPDVELDGGEPVRALVDVFDREPRIGVVAPRLVGEDGEPQSNARLYPSLAAMLGSTGAARIAPPLGRSYERYVAPSRSERARTVDWVIGGAMLIRRAAFNAVGGWDERYFLYIEDTDFCRRCIQAGWEVAFVPSVSLRHRYPRASRNAGPMATSRVRRSHVAGLARLWWREPRLMLGLGRGRGRDVDVGGGT
jgi:N-acetylglucosaminyl-diphospho-decaprenol L-rhamnosyltransferase